MCQWPQKTAKNPMISTPCLPGAPSGRGADAAVGRVEETHGRWRMVKKTKKNCHVKKKYYICIVKYSVE